MSADGSAFRAEGGGEEGDVHRQMAQMPCGSAMCCGSPVAVRQLQPFSSVPRACMSHGSPSISAGQCPAAGVNALSSGATSAKAQASAQCWLAALSLASTTADVLPFPCVAAAYLPRSSALVMDQSIW
ncbi:hypothetical protein HaLaN_01360 [Haematococcus lacustris]|uniref:Uncharacterized protein n=1 Tax=Haematococcus lacustris TaxID=44745 RepID=A0A699Y931_HAELA|nr:hypothetical protein HaLaN_01360 [Haematococcus lacustris]